MKNLWFLLLFIFSFGCNNLDKEITKISLYHKPAKFLWEDKNSILCETKNKNEIRIFNGIIESNIVENIYNKGVDVLTFSNECNADAIFLTKDDLISIKPDILKLYGEKYPIISANIYLTKDPKYQFKKYIKKEIDAKTILFTSVILNPEKLLAGDYLKSYRIENPIYELNKIFLQKADFRIVVINVYNKNETTLKEEKKIFSEFLSKLNKKPDIIITDISRDITLSETRVIPLENASIYIYKKFTFLNKIKKENLKIDKKNSIKTPILDELKTKTLTYFNKKITTSKINLTNIQTLTYLSKSIKKRIKSDFAIVCGDIVKNEIRKGDIKIRDAYSVISDYDEKLVYLKVKGDKIYDFFSYIFKIKPLIYQEKEIKENDIKNMKFIKSKTYKILINENCLKSNKEILNHIKEFSIIDVNVLDTMIWYLRNYGIKNENN